MNFTGDEITSSQLMHLIWNFISFAANRISVINTREKIIRKKQALIDVSGIPVGPATTHFPLLLPLPPLLPLPLLPPLPPLLPLPLLLFPLFPVFFLFS